MRPKECLETQRSIENTILVGPPFLNVEWIFDNDRLAQVYHLSLKTYQNIANAFIWLPAYSTISAF